jgi:hypothetical protein
LWRRGHVKRVPFFVAEDAQGGLLLGHINRDAAIAMFYFWQVDEDARASRVPPPWSGLELKGCLAVRDRARQRFDNFYVEVEPVGG